MNIYRTFKESLQHEPHPPALQLRNLEVTEAMQGIEKKKKNYKLTLVSIFNEIKM